MFLAYLRCNMANDTQHLSIENLKDIIHALRMNNFARVEDQALDEIKAMIKVLPEPEELDKMYMSPESVKNIQEAVGGIMRLVETYGKRDEEFKVRYKSRTDLPPRYKIKIEFPRHDEMEKAAMTNKHNLINDLLKLSSEADDEGLCKFAQDLINCAKIAKTELPVKELYACTLNFVGAPLVKTAQLTDINLDFSDITNGLNQITQLFATVETALQKKLQYLQKSPKTQQFIKPLKDIWAQIEQLSKITTTEIESVNKTATEMSGAMGKELTPDSITVNRKPTDIEWGEPDAEGYQSAFVTVDGKKFEVQEDERGKRSLKPMEATKHGEVVPKVEEAAPAKAPEATVTPATEPTVTEAPAAVADIGQSKEVAGAPQTPEEKWTSKGIDYKTEVEPILQPFINNDKSKMNYDDLEALLKKVEGIQAGKVASFNLMFMRLAEVTIDSSIKLSPIIFQNLKEGNFDKINVEQIRKFIANFKARNPPAMPSASSAMAPASDTTTPASSDSASGETIINPEFMKPKDYYEKGALAKIKNPEKTLPFYLKNLQEKLRTKKFTPGETEFSVARGIQQIIEQQKANAKNVPSPEKGRAKAYGSIFNLKRHTLSHRIK